MFLLSFDRILGLPMHKDRTKLAVLTVFLQSHYCDKKCDGIKFHIDYTLHITENITFYSFVFAGVCNIG